MEQHEGPGFSQGALPDVVEPEDEHQQALEPQSSSGVRGGSKVKCVAVALRTRNFGVSTQACLQIPHSDGIQ